MRTIVQLCQAVSTIGKNLLNSNISSRCLHNMVNFSLLMTETGWRVCGTPANFNGFHIFALLLQRRRSVLANQTLHDVGPSPGLVHYIYIFAFPPDGILPGAKFTLSQSLAFSYIGSVTARHSSSGRQPKFAVCYKEWNYRTFAEAPPIFGRAAITLGIGPDSSTHYFLLVTK